MSEQVEDVRADALSIPSLQFGADNILEDADQYQLHFEEIKNSDPSWVFSESPRRKVFRMGDSIIKCGPGVDLREAQTLRFIKESTKIPVPHATVVHPNTIIMDYVDGYNLEECWRQMSYEEKQVIVGQIYDILQQLRSLRGTYIGAVDRGSAVDNRKSTYTGGPFETESEFNKFLLNNMVSSTPSLYLESMRETLKKDHNIVFSHGDLSLHNFIVKDGKVMALLDWECAGWYPEYWEYVKFCSASCHEPDWHNFGHTIFPRVYHNELIRDQFYSLFVF